MRSIITVFLYIYIAKAAKSIHTLDIKNRLIGGREIEIFQAPHHASLFINGHFIGGAVLITRNHLLTAAQHVDTIIKIHPSTIIVHVLLGSSNLVHGVFLTVKRISYHSGFRRISQYIFPDNIAVIHLKESANVTDMIKPIRLPPNNLDLPADKEVYITGYKSTHAFPPSISRLHRIRLKTDNLSLCQTYFNNTVIQDTNFCSIPPAPLGCDFIDAGGPVTETRFKILVGIISDGSTNCGKDRPEIFTKVASYITYIHSEINYFSTPTAERYSHPSINFY